MGRPCVVLTTGPRHLFRATGYYLAWELADRFDVVLIGEHDYAADPAVQALLTAGRLRDFIVMPKAAATPGFHRWCVRTFTDVLDTYRPVAVLQNNHCYVWQQYLFLLARRHVPGCFNAAFLNGSILGARPLIDLLREVAVTEAARWAGRLRLPYGLTRALLRVRGEALFALNFSILPRFLWGRRLHPTFELTAPRTVTLDTAPLIDSFLCYDPREAALLKQSTNGPTDVVRHPLTTAGQAANAALFGVLPQDDLVALLPSRCIPGNPGADAGWQETAKRSGAIWADVVTHLKRAQPTTRFLWKLHPFHASDPPMRLVTEALVTAHPDVEVRSADLSAEQAMMQASVVVGDTSTVLLWAGRLGGRRVLSLDLFGVEGGNDLEGFAGVKVIGSLAALQQPDDGAEGQMPASTVVDIVDRHSAADATIRPMDDRQAIC